MQQRQQLSLFTAHNQLVRCRSGLIAQQLNKGREIMRKHIVEYCANCETEVELLWDVKKDGYKAYCPYCRARLMLCDECQHRGKGGKLVDDCNYCRESDSCRFNPPLYDLESILKRTHCKSYAELVEILYSIAELTQKTDEIERVVRVLDEIDSEDGEYDLS